MALELSKDIILSTDKRYLFLESPENESDGNNDLTDLFYEYLTEGFQFELGFDSDPRYYLLPATLLTFNTETETEN